MIHKCCCACEYAWSALDPANRISRLYSNKALLTFGKIGISSSFMLCKLLETQRILLSGSQNHDIRGQSLVLYAGGHEGGPTKAWLTLEAVKSCTMRQ